jgi:hypothetical protein
MRKPIKYLFLGVGLGVVSSLAIGFVLVRTLTPIPRDSRPEDVIVSLRDAGFLIKNLSNQVPTKLRGFGERGRIYTLCGLLRYEEYDFDLCFWQYADSDAIRALAKEQLHVMRHDAGRFPDGQISVDLGKLAIIAIPHTATPKHLDQLLKYAIVSTRDVEVSPLFDDKPSWDLLEGTKL